MNRFRIIAARLASLFSIGRRDADLNEEVQAHLELLTDEYAGRGMPRRARAVRPPGASSAASIK